MTVTFSQIPIGRGFAFDGDPTCYIKDGVVLYRAVGSDDICIEFNKERQCELLGGI